MPAFDLIPALAAYIPRDRVANLINNKPLTTDGVAMIADISGFTPLTEALTHGLSADQGAEELTRALASVFTPLIAEVHRYGGSVIKFGGDALIVWFGREKRVRKTAVSHRAVTAAWRMQQAIGVHGNIPTPIGTVSLKMKVGMAYGPVQRFNLGLASVGYEDVLAGETLDRMADAEHHAEPGDIMLDPETMSLLGERVLIGEMRDEFGQVETLVRMARPKPWPELVWDAETATSTMLSTGVSLAEQLAAYVPQAIYETLLTGRNEVAELKPVVSLFVQFHGIDYDADPDVSDKLQAFFSQAQRVVARYNGRLNRLITGDKGSLLHIIFGAPRSVEEQEERAVRCALDLQTECGSMPFIGMQRIGVTAGRVFAGPVGSPNRHDYTTMGDTINLSARLMQNAADNQVLLETAVTDQLDDSFELTDLGSIRVKGKSMPIPVFAAIGVHRAERMKHRVVHLFGRERETAVVQTNLDALTDQQGGALLIIGEVGMGKTLMLDNIRARTEAAWLHQRDGGLWAGGICLAYGETMSGYLFIDLLRDLLNLPAGATPDQTSTRLEMFCADLFGEDKLPSTYPYLARFMGLPLPASYEERLAGLAGESVRWRLFELVPELVRIITEQFPLVLTVDDLQWADPTSRQLIEGLLPLTQERPFLLIMATRPRQVALDLAENDFVQPVPLQLLNERAATDLLNHLAPNLPQRILSHLIEKAGGNPLFLVELARTLQVSGLLSGDANLETVELDALELPSSVQGLLLAQLDRLAIESRHMLQMASVIGKTFFDEVLAYLAGAERQVDEQLSKLSERDFILMAVPTELGDTHVFRHGLIQESAYSTLLYERRRRYHRQVAEALESLFPASIGEQSAFLAYHYEHADVIPNAIYYLQQTADKARLLFANEEAESLYKRILALMEQQEAPDENGRARTLLKLAQVYANRMDFMTAQTFYEQAFGLLAQVEGVERGEGNGRVFHWGVLDEYTQRFDPGTVEAVETTQIINNLFDGLVELDNEWNIIPAAARRWRIEDGGLRYIFDLRPDLTWSDGQPLTAHDFVFAWQRNLSPATGAVFVDPLYVVAGAEAVHQGENPDVTSIGVTALDNLTLEIRLLNPASQFLYVLADSVTFPQPAHAVNKLGDAWSLPQNLVSNGAFVVDQSTWQTTRALAENPAYRGFATGNVGRIELRSVHPDIEPYANGDIDWCRVDDQGNIPQRFPSETFLVQDLMTFVLGFACHVAPFDNPLVRQALIQAIDREALVNEVWAGVQNPANGGIVPPGMSGHSPEINLPFVPMQARRILDELAKSGSAIETIRLATLPGFGGTPAFIQQSWESALGIDVELLDGVPADAFIGGLRDGTIHAGLFGLSVGYPDPNDILRPLGHSQSPFNFFHWSNARFDALVEQAGAAQDQRERLRLYHEADRVMVVEETAVSPLYYLQAYGLLREQFQLGDTGRIVRGGTIKFKNIRYSP